MVGRIGTNGMPGDMEYTRRYLLSNVFADLSGVTSLATIGNVT